MYVYLKAHFGTSQILSLLVTCYWPAEHFCKQHGRLTLLNISGCSPCSANSFLSSCFIRSSSHLFCRSSSSFFFLCSSSFILRSALSFWTFNSSSVTWMEKRMKVSWYRVQLPKACKKNSFRKATSLSECKNRCSS